MVIRTSEKDQVIDITEDLEKELDNKEKQSGVLHVFVKHTTCAITTADLDPGTDLDLLDVLRKILPDISYRHPRDPSHTPDHILSSIIGPSLSIPFKNKKLDLGTWQRVILVELDGPRERDINISITS